MSEEVIENISNVPVTVDPQTAEDRGDNFIPNDDPVVLDNNGDTIETPAAAAAPAAAEATDEGEGEPGPEGGGRIPKARFNEVNEARKLAQTRADLLQAELDRLRASGTPAPAPAAAAPAADAFDVKAQERAYADAMLEGDVDRALEIRETINDHIMQEAEQRATRRVSANLSAQQSANALQAASNQAVQDYPFLDTAEGADALELILLARDRDIAAGKPAHVALADAVAKIAPRFAPEGSNTPSRESTGSKARVDTRTADALARGAADSNLQPPAIVNGIGNRATQGRIDVSNLTEAQFEQLSAADKKKLRGD